MDDSSCLAKQDQLKKLFEGLPSQEERYQKIIAMGRAAKPLDACKRTEDRLVPGCQSLLYLDVSLIDGRLFLQAYSDALISSGLAELLIQVYQGEPPQSVIHCPPLFLKELGILSSLSPSRANGLKSLYEKLQKESLKFIASPL